MAKTVKIELYTEERNFIIELLEYALLDGLINKLKKAKSNKNNFVTVSLDDFDLEQLIGNLSLEANHNKKRSIQDAAYKLAERFEAYEFQLRRIGI